MSWIEDSKLTDLIPRGLGITCLILVIFGGLRWWSYIYEYCMEKRRIFKFAKTVPGPAGYPILGNILELWHTDRAVETLTRIGREMDSKMYKLWLGPGVVKIVISDPRDLEIVLMSPIGANKDDIFNAVRPVVINTIVDAKVSPTFRSHKNIMMPQINGNSVMTNYVNKFNIHSRKLVQVLNKKVDAGVFDVTDHLHSLLCDIVFETLYNIKGTAQLGEINVLRKYTSKIMHVIYYRMMRPWFLTDFPFNLTAMGKLYFKVIKEVHIFIDNVIAKKKESYQALSPEETSKLPLLDFLVNHRIKTGTWTDKEIRYEAIALFTASYETIEGVLGFALLMMAMNPDVQEKAREEIRNVVQSDDVSESEIKDLKYIDMILREVIRLFPVIPMMPRRLTNDLKLSTCTVPKGTSLFLLAHATHRDPEYWDEPEKFNPEHFTPENSKDRHPYAYVPFAAGLRRCAGSKYAITCIKVIVVHILRAYQLNTTLKYENLRLHSHLSTRSVDGYPISLKKL